MVVAVVMVVILLCCCSCEHQTTLAGRVQGFLVTYFFIKVEVVKLNLMFAKLGEMIIYLHFKQKELAASKKKLLLFATFFLVMRLTFKPEAKGRWWRGSFWGNTWPRKRDAMPRPSIDFYFWLYALKLMNQDVSTAG